MVTTPLAPLRRLPALIGAWKREEALELLDGVLKTLDVRVDRSGDSVRVSTEWAHSLEGDDADRYYRFVGQLLEVRRSLLLTAGGKLRPQGLIDRLTQFLEKSVVPELKWVETHMSATEFKHGKFTIYLTSNARDGLADALSTLDKVSAKIQPKFPEVLYGKVYVRREPRMSGTFGAPPEATPALVAGGYAAASDTINLSLYATPTRSSIETLIHEFGHRYHTRFLSGDARKRFEQLSTVGDVQEISVSLAERQKAAADYLRLLLEHRKENYPESKTFLSRKTKLFTDNFPRDEWKKHVVPLMKRFRDDGDDSVRGALLNAIARSHLQGTLEIVLNEQQLRPVHASLYGSTSWKENFAETFLAYVIGSPLPAPLEDFMKAL